jgi:hypothetical protein
MHEGVKHVSAEEFQSDAEAMKVFRGTAELVIEGTSGSELFQSSPTIA